MSKKRKSSAAAPSLFAALSKLEEDDVRAARTRRKLTAASVSRSLSARSQSGISGDIVQCRILLQRAVGETSSKTSNGEKAISDDDGGTVDLADRLLIKLLESRGRLGSCKESPQNDEKRRDYSVLIESDFIINDLLREEHHQARSDWKEVFNRRHHDLRLHAGLTAKTASKFRIMDQSFWDQIESTSAHERLLRAGQRNRQEEERDETGSNEAVLESLQNDRNIPTFDDSKVYQHMLRDFVALRNSSKGGASTGAGFVADAAAERLRRAAQKKKGQSEKDVDRKASKGRKIRYTVNSKLSGYTFPVSRKVPSIGDDEWFRSLFGGAGIKRHKAY